MTVFFLQIKLSLLIFVVSSLVEDELSICGDMKHFKLTDETIEVYGHLLHRIVCTRSFGDCFVTPGALGGFVESEANLEESGWVADNACVMGGAVVSGYAMIEGRARVFGNSRVSGRALVRGAAWVYGKACVCGDAIVRGDAVVKGDAYVGGRACVGGHAVLGKNCRALEEAVVDENANVLGGAFLTDRCSWLTITNIGSRNDSLCAYRSETGVCVQVGCFCGSLEAFEVRVKEVHGKSKYTRDYMAAIKLIRSYFGVPPLPWWRRCLQWLAEVVHCGRRRVFIRGMM